MENKKIMVFCLDRFNFMCSYIFSVGKFDERRGDYEDFIFLVILFVGWENFC